ncbi:hypothetical protein ElyMa_006652200 [Elysia marginata]|uniref:Uncharacterized protein n=1 Tax=Elysia marginata TaxID=1093978 RepID=A0AAV4ILA1_9GAST|nr:hypothetical protein ElyMa_006652200 [Elysia marginata]
MPENELNSTASRFISSLIKSLQIICNGHIDFHESIELVGHINLRVDHKFKYDYIVDELVSKEGLDSSTFLSNSYHSSPPQREKVSKDGSSAEDDLSLPSLQPERCKQTSETILTDGQGNENYSYTYGVDVESAKEHGTQKSKMVFKLEGGEESNECMIIPSAAGGYEPARHANVAEMIASGTIGAEEGQDTHNKLRAQKRQATEQGVDENSDLEACQYTYCENNQQLTLVDKTETFDNSFHSINENIRANSESLDLSKSSPKKLVDEQGDHENSSFEPGNQLKEFKLLISKLASMCNMPVLQDDLINISQNRYLMPFAQEIKAAKKKFLENCDKDKLKKMKEVLKMKKSKQRKSKLKALLAESGLSNEQLLILAQDSSVYRRKISWKSMADGPDKEAMLKSHKKSIRMRTQERQQRLLEMAEMLKRNQTNDPGMAIMSKDGCKKCTLHKSSVSVVSHNTYQLSVDNIDEVAEALTGKTTKAFLLQQKVQDKSKEKSKVEQNRKTSIKKKMKQIIGKMLTEVTDAGYRVLVTSTVGSEAGSHSSELSVMPLKIDDFFPETKESEVKPELTEEEYAKQLEREQIMEKQKVNEEKMKEIETKLIRILSGAEEIFIPTRKRYSPGEPRPSDAERMKEYRKRLKQDPEKYQVYKQKRAMNKKWRKLGQLAAKVKVNTPGSALSVIPASVNEEVHNTQPLGSIVNINQPVANVNMHCPPVFEHPASHQPSASVVSVHHTNQYVSQVSGIHAPHQQPITYGNDMEFVELIAATHNVQNQHFG